MTARPDLGPRQPQRSSSASIAQRPPQPGRALSQQFAPSSSARRVEQAVVDLTFDAADAALGRPAIAPKNGGSPLKVDMTKDAKASTVVDPLKPAAEATPSWRPSLPPRGRPLLHFDLPSTNSPNSRAAEDGAQPGVTIKPMPLPVRPGRNAPSSFDKARIASRTPPKKDARPKPYTLEVPTAAPHYPPNGHADFFPWTGKHPEDRFTEATIRQGFFDKAQMTQNETGSAKASILPPLKHKSGLQTLSSLFTSVLAQRRAHGQITSSSTFKPPPRVTVTDTKREMWLKDLANPAISLRRLSRSIPHGIRGKVLLDQSLSKNIPLERAVWLAKCVGANELRSFRRKGANGLPMGGEGKWIRDFTVCVEQFVESAVGSCGEKDFRSRVNYVIRLSAHFHAEHLLDRDHYLDWLVSSLENSQQAKLPMWLLITQIYWKDILHYRKFGRRLSTALLNHWAATMVHPDRDILVPLSDRLELALKELMESHPESFVSSVGWTKHRTLIQTSLAPDDARFAALFASIDRRNSRLAAPAAKKEPSPRKCLIQLLDTTLEKPFTSELLEQCWQVDDDKDILVQAVLEWATSFYRPGTAKIYVAVRLLRHWTRSGVDVTQGILSFLDSKACERGRNKPALYHLVCELARSEHFSTPMYLQWVIARGGLYDAADVARGGPCATRLLAELPVHNFTESMDTLRRTLLSRADFSVDDEEEQIRAYMAFLAKCLPGMQANVDLESDPDVAIADDKIGFSPELSRGSKSEVGLWLRQKVRLQMLQPTIPPLDDWDDSPMKGGTSAITLSDFNIVRQSLEHMEDFSILADVLKMVSSSNDAEVLASCADTINLHLDSFAAIGALKSLFEILTGRLRSLTEDDSFPRVLLVSLSELAARIPEQNDVARQLAQELSRSDRKTAADACSPVSDHMAGVTQSAESDFTDEMEKVLGSGNNMDQATLERLFQRIAIRLEGSWEKSLEQYRSCGLLFTRLRTFDAQRFDVLMAAWVNRVLQMETRPSMIQVFGPLISFGCLALQDVVSNCVSVIENEMALHNSIPSKVAEEVLALLIAPSSIPETMTDEEAYRLRVKQANMQRDHPLDILSVIRRSFLDALDSNQVQPGAAPAQVETLLGRIYGFLQRLVLVDTDSIIQRLIVPLLASASMGAAATVSAIVDGLLTDGKRNADTPIPIDVVVSLADCLTLPFCQVKLASIFIQDKSSPTTVDESDSECLQAFDNAIGSAVTAGNTAWAYLIPSLDISIVRHLRKRAETEFISICPSLKTASTEDIPTMRSRIQQANNLLYIVDATTSSLSVPTSATSLAPEIVTVLNNMWLLLCGTQIQVPEMKELMITEWLPLLLSFTTIHTSAFEETKAGHEDRSKALLALAAIMLELQALDNSTGIINTTTQDTFDIALHLVDALPDDMRQQCIRSLRDTISNRQVSYLFSIPTDPSGWLVLSQKERIGGSGGAEGRGIDIEKEKLAPFPLRRWEMLGEPTPNVGENDTSLSLTLFDARRY